MKKLKYEFLNKNDGQVIVVGENSTALLQELPELVDILYEQIHIRYPQAFASLLERYASSALNTKFHRYLCVRRFVMCNFGEYDIKTYDIEDIGKWNLEKVQCPLRGECKYENVICRPTAGTCLSSHEMNIVRLLCEGVSVEDMAARLHISVHTVRNHRRNIYRKLGIHNRRTLITWYNNTITQ